jgi:hypothetical protein
MPFTIAHAAVAPPVWKLSRGRLVLSALAVGATAPDLEYLIHLRTHRTIGHTLPGIFVLCVPLTLVVLALWHKLIGPQLSRLLPERLAPLAAVASRPFRFFGAGRFTMICLSAALGAYSHIVWDSFTHENSWFPERFEVLRDHAWNGGPQLVTLLQYGSSVLGLLLLARWTWDLLRHRPSETPARRLPPLDARRRWGWSLLLAAGVSATACANAARLAIEASWATPRDVIAAGLVGAMAGLVPLAAAASALLAVGERVTVRRTLRS